LSLGEIIVNLVRMNSLPGKSARNDSNNNDDDDDYDDDDTGLTELRTHGFP